MAQTRSMRRGHQQVTDPETLARCLREATVGRLATLDEHGYPVVKPVNFVFAEGSIYFHSAAAGEKLDDIRRYDRVGFEVDRVFAVVPPTERGCQTACFYQSVVIRGRARILDGEPDRPLKERALRLLVEKHAPAFVDTPLVTIDQTAVVAIEVESLTGKENFGQRWPRERKLAIARLLWERDGASADETIRLMGLSPDEL